MSGIVSSVVVLGCSPLQDDLVHRTFLLGTFRTLSLGSDTEEALLDRAASKGASLCGVSRSDFCLLLGLLCVPPPAYGAGAAGSFQHDPVEYYGARVLAALLVFCSCLVVYSLARYRGRIAGPVSLGLLIAGIGVLPVISVSFGTVLVFQRAERVEFCASCHEPMQPYVDDMMNLESESMAAVHYKNRYIPSNQCYDCHTSYGLFGTAEAKTKGLVDMYKYYTDTYHVPIQMRSPYPNNDCLKCHAESLKWLQQELHTENKEALFAGDTSCMECHDPMGHPAHILPEQP